jgi:hypothetical protein
MAVCSPRETGLGAAKTVLVGTHVRTSLTLLMAAALCTGCGAKPEQAPQSVASSFARALAEDDGGTACALLARETKAELEQSAGTACPAAIRDEDLPTDDAVEKAATFGTMAQVVLGQDVVFLTEFKGRWRVMAAGCAPSPSPAAGRPYDCQLQGG